MVERADIRYSARPKASLKGILNDLIDPSKYVIFQYNPPEIVEQKNVSWAQAKIPGGDATLDTFASGSSPEISMTLLFNVHGETPNPELGITDVNYVENTIAFFYQYLNKDPEQVLNSPRLLLLTLGRLRLFDSFRAGVGSVPSFSSPVYLKSMSVRRLLFDSEYRTTRAELDLVFVRVFGAPR